MFEIEQKIDLTQLHYNVNPITMEYPQFTIGQEKAIEEIKNLIDTNISFLVIGERGVGKTHLFRNCIIPHLELRSEQVFGPGSNKRLYHILPMGFKASTSELEDIEKYLVYTFDLPPIPPDKLESIDASVWPARIEWLFEEMKKKGIQCYLLIDDIETVSPQATVYLRLWMRHVTIIATSRPITYGSKSDPFFKDMQFKTVYIYQLDKRDAILFYNEYLSQIGFNLPEPLKEFLLTKLLQSIYFIPGAAIATINWLANLSRRGINITKQIIREAPLSSLGLRERDLTGFFILPLIIVMGMRFLAISGFQRWTYFIFAVMSSGGYLILRIFVFRKLMKPEKPELIFQEARSLQLPFWVRKNFYWIFHVLASNLFLVMIFSTISTYIKLPHLVICSFASLFPDLDIETSTISRLWHKVFSKLPKIINNFFCKIISSVFPELELQNFSDFPSQVELKIGHRTAFHSLLGIAYYSFLTIPLFFYDKLYWFSSVIGYTGHVLYDAISPAGIKLTWPTKHSWGLPKPQQLRVPVGSVRELILSFCVLLPLFLFFLYVAIHSWSTVTLNLTGLPFVMAPEINKYFSDYQVYLNITGTWTNPPIPAREEPFEVIALEQNDVFCVSLNPIRANKVYKISSVGETAITLRKVKVKKGERIRMEYKVINITMPEDLSTILDKIPPKSFVTGRITGIVPQDINEIFAPKEVLEEYQTIKITKFGEKTQTSDIVFEYALPEQLKILCQFPITVLSGSIIITQRQPVREIEKVEKKQIPKEEITLVKTLTIK